MQLDDESTRSVLDTGRALVPCSCLIPARATPVEQRRGAIWRDTGNIVPVFDIMNAGPRNRFVILTSSDAEEDRLKCQLLSVDSYITKPVNLEKFLTVVKQLRLHWLADVILPNLE